MSLRKQYLMGCISLLFIKISLAFISYAFNPSKELAKVVPNGFHFTFFYFFTVNLFLSPVGRCVEYSVAVQLRLFPFIEFWVRNGILDFKNQQGLSTFFYFKMFYLTGRVGRVGWSVKRVL